MAGFGLKKFTRKVFLQNLRAFTLQTTQWNTNFWSFLKPKNYATVFESGEALIPLINGTTFAPAKLSKNIFFYKGPKISAMLVKFGKKSYF